LFPDCQGFLDFVLNGNVVDLAVGVVVGMAFTLLMQAFTEDFLTPALGAIFAGEGKK
jgi:large conductance mechanosensitive channel